MNLEIAIRPLMAAAADPPILLPSPALTPTPSRADCLSAQEEAGWVGRLPLPPKTVLQKSLTVRDYEL